MAKKSFLTILFLGIGLLISRYAQSQGVPAGASASVAVPPASMPASALDAGGSVARNAGADIPGGYVTIHNDFYWDDDKGARILTRSGCLCQFNGLFYWYGGNPRGFMEQYCYTSTDLVHWTNKGVVLRHTVDANRIDVLYNEMTKKYVMLLKYDGNGAHFGVATADVPEGPFTFQTQTLVDDALMGDMSAFKDSDGKAYIAYVSWAVGTNAQHGIYQLSADYTKLEKRIYLWDIRSREAPHIFKRNGIYYYGTSRTAGIQSSGTSYYTAKDLAGPWSPAKPLATPGSNNSWDSQIDFVYPIQGTQGMLYMFAGDRWTKDLPAGRNGDYIWLPVEFDGDVPVVNYYQDWDLNLSAGTWRKFDSSRNLALGKTATASSENGMNAAKNVTDATTYQNYMSTKWESAGADPQWISVDLGEPKEVNRVILKWDANYAKAFKIEVSADGAAWTEVYSTTTGGSYAVTDEKFKTVTARYVRMTGTERGVPPAGRGGRGGRGGRAGAPPAAAPAGQPVVPPTAVPAAQGEYALFDFQVLKD